jgi:hypothetical protein
MQNVFLCTFHVLHAMHGDVPGRRNPRICGQSTLLATPSITMRCIYILYWSIMLYYIHIYIYIYILYVYILLSLFIYYLLLLLVVLLLYIYYVLCIYIYILCFVYIYIFKLYGIIFCIYFCWGYTRSPGCVFGPGSLPVCYWHILHDFAGVGVVCGGVSWGGVGDVIMFACICAATWCYVKDGVGSVEMGGAKTFACMRTRTWCYVRCGGGAEAEMKAWRWWSPCKSQEAAVKEAMENTLWCSFWNIWGPQPKAPFLRLKQGRITRW